MAEAVGSPPAASDVRTVRDRELERAISVRNLRLDDYSGDIEPMVPPV